MKNILISFSIVAIAVAFSGCSKSNNGPSNIANVNFVNGCNGSLNIDTKVNNTKLIAASNLPYFKYSGYQNVTGGASVAINLFLTNQGTPLCNGTPALTAGDYYTVFAGGIVTHPTFVVTTDDLTAPTSGNAKVRFINLSSDTLNESCYIGTQKLDSNLVNNAVTSFSEITATTGVAVLLQDPSHAAPAYIAQLASQPFSAGKIYTIMLTGTSTVSGTGGLTLTVINNN